MIDRDDDRVEESADERETSTSPPGGKTHEATTPPGQGEVDEEALREGEGRLDQAGGGY